MTADKEYRLRFTEEAEELVSRMTPEEKAELMTGCNDMDALREAWRQTGNFSYHPYVGSGCEAYDIPRMVFADGPRGVVLGAGKSTCFPAPILRGATFDTALEEEIGHAIGRELRAYGANTFGGVCANVPYHGGWGRMQEAFGEDTFAVGEMASALVRSVQSEGILATVKHYALNSMEYSRLKVDVTADERTVREVYLPQFKACIDAGAAAVMTALNRFRGSLAGESRYLIRDILKNEWDFDGIVMGDWFSGIKDTVNAVNAGLDLEMPVPAYYGTRLCEKVRSGELKEEQLDEAAVRIVRTLLAFEQARKEDPREYTPDMIGCEAHAALALRSAREGITLLKNAAKTLPFRKNDIRTIAILGPFGKSENTGDHGSGQVYPKHVSTLLDAVAEVLPNAQLIYFGGDNLMHAKMVAAEADAVIITAGSSYRDEGEFMSEITSADFRRTAGGDRETLSLRQEQIDLIQTVSAINKKTAVVLFGGGPFTMKEWISCAPAVLMAYYPGQEGGRALTDILFGAVCPGGRLPFAIPMEESDLPEISWHTEHQHYGYYHGYTKLEKDGKTPLFPYGFGLSYTTFSVTAPSFTAEENRLLCACTVKNTGSMAGDEVIQVYAGFENSAVDRPVKSLIGFTRVSLKPGEAARVTVPCPFGRLMYYSTEAGRFELEHMEYSLFIGTSSDNSALLRGAVTL